MGKIRNFLASALLAVATSLMAVLPAAALEFSILGPDAVTVNPGEEFTIDIALDNLLGESVQGVTATISGMLSAGAFLTSGRAAPSYFVGFCSPSQCFGGINFTHSPFINLNDLSASGVYTQGDDSAVLVNALALGATSLTGALDPGIDGAINEPSPRDVTLTLQAMIPGIHTFTIGGDFSDGVNVLPITNTATFTVTVVPEPTSALMIGLGLTTLAATSKRRGRKVCIRPVA